MQHIIKLFCHTLPNKTLFFFSVLYHAIASAFGIENYITSLLLILHIISVSFSFYVKDINKMSANAGAPCRGSAAAAASLQRRRSSAGGGAASTMLRFCTDDATGHKMSSNNVLFMSVGFFAVVALLHVVGKLYLIRQ